MSDLLIIGALGLLLGLALASLALLRVSPELEARWPWLDKVAGGVAIFTGGALAALGIARKMQADKLPEQTQGLDPQTQGFSSTTQGLEEPTRPDPPPVADEVEDAIEEIDHSKDRELADRRAAPMDERRERLGADLDELFGDE